MKATHNKPPKECRQRKRIVLTPETEQDDAGAAYGTEKETWNGQATIEADDN